MVPAPSGKTQTAVIDLEKSLKGQDISTGIRAFHIHNTPGCGTFKITDARLMTSPEGEKGDGNAGDSNKKNTVEKDNSKKTVEIVTDDPKGTATGTVGSTKAPSNSVPVWAIAIGVGAVVVVVIAVVVSKSKKIKEN